MINPDILRFITLRQREGMSRENIRNLLIYEGGWAKDDVEEAFGIIDHDTNRPSIPPPMKAPVKAQAAPVKQAPSGVPVAPIKPTQSFQAGELSQHTVVEQSSEKSYASIIAGVVLFALIAAGVVLIIFTDVFNL